ncbi:hypothetical protein EJB05_47379, partial [Eragrostis curvula]
MAVSAIGGWMASAGIAKLVDQVCCYAGDQYEYQRNDAKKKLRRLKESLSKIRAVVDKAERLQTKNQNMESWLCSIKDAVYRAEDVLSLFDYRVLEAEDTANSYSSSTAGCSIKSATTITTPSTSTSSSSTVSRSVRVLRRILFSDEDLNELIAIVGRFDKIASEMPTLLELVKLENRRSEPSIQWRKTTSMLGTTEFYGRVCEKTQLENLIVQTHDKSSQPYSVISVVGLPGVGKTALVQRVYSHFRDIGYFDFMAWIHVSEKFDAERLTKEMIQAQKCCKMKRRRDGRSRISWHASRSADSNNISNFDQVQQILQENVNGKKIFVVLDDIWNEMSSQWENLSKPLQFASKGSKVLLTTRSHRVAKINGATEIMPLDGLKDEDFWGHFTKCAFGNEPPAEYPQLENIGRLIAKKLTGSPLAARTVGGKLKQELHEDHWRSVLGCKLWHIEQKEDDIIPALQLSYEHLPDNLKQCFIYFAFFPKKYPLRGDILIQMWRAQGYIQKETRDENAQNYIKDLLQLSFIQKATNLDDHYVVHDLLHDFAELVSNGEHFRIEDDFHVRIPENVRHLYVNANNEVKKGIRSLIICKHDPASGDGIPPSNFDKTLEETLHLPQLRSLRVLMLHDQDGILPENIGHLIHLRYLDISGSRITNLPESLFKLYHLQWLNLQFCYNNNVKVGLQKGISRLTQLRYLMAPPEIITGIEHIGRLTFLRTLDEYHVMRDSRYSICQLKELNEVRGKLTIKNLEKVTSREESSEARLSKKQNLKKISFFWSHLQELRCRRVTRCCFFPKRGWVAAATLNPGVAGLNDLTCGLWVVALPLLQAAAHLCSKSPCMCSRIMSVDVEASDLVQIAPTYVEAILWISLVRQGC